MPTEEEVLEDGSLPSRYHNHNQAPVRSDQATPLAAAQEYLAQVSQDYQLNAPAIASSSLKVDRQLTTGEEASLRLVREKQIMDTSVVSYAQTYMGIPVWDAGVTVTMLRDPIRVISSVSTFQPDIHTDAPTPEGLSYVDSFSEQDLVSALGLPGNDQQLKISSKQLFIYQFNPARRVDHHEGNDHAELPSFPLPPIPDNLVDGHYYPVLEVLFSNHTPSWGDLNWRIFIELNSRTVVYLRALIDFADALVFTRDPITKTGNMLSVPSAGNPQLNPLRDPVTLPGLTGPGTTLQGNFVRIVDFESPAAPPPAVASGSAFSYSVRTNDFAATNAYYHCDALFRMVQEMGFPIGDYFDGTTFPVPVDHRALGITINAQSRGNAAGNGQGSLAFGLADLGDTTQPIGIANDWRVVLHEFGHSLLWDHVNSPNFGFAHSAGDSLASILNDPDSLAPDRFVTFPWVDIGRRHDRAVSAGWGWGGSHDTGGYASEQVLSTTLFRFYRSIGGDSPDSGRRKFAARFAAYLIIRAIGLLTPPTNPSNASGFELKLEDADAGKWIPQFPAETHAGGAYHKVIRWAFEKQGLYRAPLSPTTSEGRAPAVDVYIEDGRHGEYPFLRNHWSTTDIWNRRAADGSTVHQEPVTGQVNFAYVRVRNRGYLKATQVRVKGFHADPGAGLTFPDDWKAMTTTELAAPDIPPGGSVIVGPFQWKPTHVGHECLFMSASAKGDASNIDGRVIGPIPEWRLVPNDNNLAQRNVVPVPGGLKGLLAALTKRPFLIRNPYDRDAKIEIRFVLPAFLREKGWKAEIIGGENLALAPKEKREVLLQLHEGRKYALREVLRKDNAITVEVYADGMLIGGMTYALDTRLKTSLFAQP